MIVPDALLKKIQSDLDQKVQLLSQELQGIRGTRPTPELLEHIRVSYYDQLFTVQQLASISIRPPRELTVQAWDQGSIPAVQKAIEDAKLGVSVSRDDNVIRVNIPSLTSERKEQLAKLIKKNAEETRVAVRSIRDDYNKQLKTAEGAKELTEDQFFKLKEQVQKAVDKANTDVEGIVERKLGELEA